MLSKDNGVVTIMIEDSGVVAMTVMDCGEHGGYCRSVTFCSPSTTPTVNAEPLGCNM